MKLIAMLLALPVAMVSLGGSMTAMIAQGHKVKLTDVWYGGERTVFDFEGYDAWFIEPPQDVNPANGRPWTWTMQWREAFVPRTAVPQLLKRGWHHVSIDTFKDRMDENGLAVSRRFQEFLVNAVGLSPKACLIGMSWGGFFSVRYAAHNLQCVDKIYLDCPCLNLGGCRKPLDIGPWKMVAPENWIDDPRMPINMAQTIAAARIPVLLVYGGADDTLDPKLNAEIFASRFKKVGGNVQVICRAGYGHHPHGFEIGESVIPRFFCGE